jgi:hypothetical protein
MSKKQDRQGVRTASDLERKYNLGQSVSQSYVQSAVQSAVAVSENEVKRYVDVRVDGLTVQTDRINEVERTAEQAQQDAEDAKTAAEEAQATVEELWKHIASDVEATGLIVTVEADSLATENLTSDKTFTEIEVAILLGMNVIVKLLCDGVDHHIYLHMTSHLQGSEISFSGYFNNMPLVLKIMAEQQTGEE